MSAPVAASRKEAALAAIATAYTQFKDVLATSGAWTEQVQTLHDVSEAAEQHAYAVGATPLDVWNTLTPLMTFAGKAL